MLDKNKSLNSRFPWQLDLIDHLPRRVRDIIIAILYNVHTSIYESKEQICLMMDL